MLSGAAIKEKALSIGFDLCGIAPVDGFPELSFLRGVVGEGLCRRDGVDGAYGRDVAPMSATSFPAHAASIVTGTLYNTDRPYSSDLPPDLARISRYAWGDDYHDVLKARLRRRCSPGCVTESDESFDARAYVDTGPVQERVYAQYAGLGWIGKNTCLINPELGSWLFLGEIICTLPLEPGHAGTRAVRKLHALSRGVPDRRTCRAGRAGLEPVSVVSHHRVAVVDSGRVSAARSEPTCTAVTSARRSVRTTARRRGRTRRNGNRGPASICRVSWISGGGRTPSFEG